MISNNEMYSLPSVEDFCKTMSCYDIKEDLSSLIIDEIKRFNQKEDLKNE